MKMTPIQRDTLRKQAKQDALLEAPRRNPTIRHKLAADQRRLEAIQSHQARVEVKRPFFQEDSEDSYMPYIHGVLDADTGEQDDVLMWCMIWSYDTEEYELSQRIAEYALDNGLRMPSKFSRGLAPWLAESYAKVVLESGDEEPATQYALELAEVLQDYDMHDEVRSKLYKAAAIICEQTNPADALEFYKSALKFNPKAAVKQKIKLLEKEFQNPQEHDAATAHAKPTANAEAVATVDNGGDA